MASKKAQESALLSSMAEGQFGRTVTLGEANQWTAGSEAVIKVWGSNDNKQILVYGVCKAMFWSPAEENLPYEWFVVKTDDDAIPNISEAATFERLMLDKKIFDRGAGICRYKTAGGPVAGFQTKVFNVTLEEDEHLQVIVLPYKTSAGANISQFVRVESRTLDLD